MAARLGARSVTLYEEAEVIEVARRIARKSGIKGCRFVSASSLEVESPERVDVVVSETLGNYAFEENIIDTLADARKRHLKDGGVLIPSRITQFVAPVVSDRLHKELTVWDGVGHGLDLSPAKAMSLNNVYVRTLDLAELLDGGNSARAWDAVTLGAETRASRKGEVTWKPSAAATIYGFAYWWTAELVPGIALSTAPDAPRTHWEQLYFPLRDPIALKKGESLMLSLRSKSSEETGTHLAWTAVHFDKEGKSISRQAMDLDKGWIP